jgi:hypothetical protein
LCGHQTRGLRILAIDYRFLPRERPSLPSAAVPSIAPIDLLKFINPRADALSDDWRLVEGELISPNAGRLSLLQIPYQPPEEFDLVAEVERLGPLDPKLGSFSLDLGLSAAGRQFGAVFGSRDGQSAGGTLSALNWVDGMWAGDPAACYRGEIFKEGAIVAILLSVRKQGLRVSVDGRTIIEWTDYTRLSRNSAYRIPDSRCLFLASWLSYRFQKLELVPVRGSGEMLR